MKNETSRPGAATPKQIGSAAVSGAGPALLRDHQPDIRFQGDSLRRALLRHRSEAAFITDNIQLELSAMAASGDECRRGQGRAWVFEAQRWRRDALAHASAYERLLAEREHFASVVGFSAPPTTAPSPPTKAAAVYDSEIQ